MRIILLKSIRELDNKWLRYYKIGRQSSNTWDIASQSIACDFDVRLLNFDSLGNISCRIFNVQKCFKNIQTERSISIFFLQVLLVSLHDNMENMFSHFETLGCMKQTR